MGKNQPAKRRYRELIDSIGVLLKQARQKAFRQINSILVETYWEVGRNIVVYEQQNKMKAQNFILYLVRHGGAVPEQVDPARPLSEKGRFEVEETARQLKDQGARVDEIWHSGKLRARQTAEIIARILNINNIFEKPGLKPNDDAAAIAELLRQTGKTILIAGHLPFIPKLANLLKPELGIKELKSGGMLKVKY